MTWLFSKALCESLHSSPEPVAASSADTCSDGEPYAQWNVMPTPQGFWRNDRMMDASRLSQFGPTLQLLTESHGEAVLTSFLEGFPVRTSPLPEEAKESAEQDPGFGLSSLESLAKYDRDTSTWKTPQFSLLGGWDEFSETWPRWGLMRNGECWVQPMLALRTSGTESGLWPTPNVPNGGRSLSHVTEWSESGRTAYHKGKKVQVGLESAVKLWATPQAHDKTAGRADRVGRFGTKHGGRNLNDEAVAESGLTTGQLNPEWVEWLMGWPGGWTELKPLAMARFQEWQQQHSLNWLEGSDAA